MDTSNKRSNDDEMSVDMSAKEVAKKCPALNDSFYEQTEKKKNNDTVTILEHVVVTCVENVEQGHGEF